MELDNRLKGQYCPGEEACSETATFPFFEDEIEPASPEAEERCKTCQLRETKPGTEDPELTAWIARALDIDLMKNSGGSFDVDSLTIWDWAAACRAATLTPACCSMALGPSVWANMASTRWAGSI